MRDWSRVQIAAAAGASDLHHPQAQAQAAQAQQAQYVLPPELQHMLAARNLGGSGHHFLAISREPMSPPPAPVQSSQASQQHFQAQQQQQGSRNMNHQAHHHHHLPQEAAHHHHLQYLGHHNLHSNPNQVNVVSSSRNESSPEAAAAAAAAAGSSSFKHLLCREAPSAATAAAMVAGMPRISNDHAVHPGENVVDEECQEDVHDEEDEDEEDDEERSSAGGTRWPCEETRALIKTRAEMDASFRNPASPKAHLWDEISRKLAAMGYMRSAKKCKEKFDNITKYYKRTKEGKGKSYRFFEELEAFYGSNSGLTIGATEMQKDGNGTLGGAHTLIGMANVLKEPDGACSEPRDIQQHNYDVNSSSESSAEYDEPSETFGEHEKNVKKRKRKSWKARMAFFENLVKKFVEKQEAMQHKFLELLEKREQERIKREETWRKQEVARLNREYELRVEEHARRINYDAALAAALQKATGHVLDIPQGPAPSPYSNNTLGESNEDHPKEGCDSMNKRWPRAEVQALIQLRAAMEAKFQEVGPKGPFWEEISAGLACQGYIRSAKRCKEKWENINKYYRKTSTKKRPENTKTCPYFQELDALYQKGIIGTPSTKNEKKFEETTDEIDESNRDDNSSHAQGEAEVLSIMPSSEATPSNAGTTTVTAGLFSSPENCAQNTESRLQNNNSRNSQKRSWMDGGNGSLGLSFDALQGAELFCGSSNKTLKFDGFAKDILEAQRHQRMQQLGREQQQHAVMVQDRQSQEFQEAESSATRGCNLVEGFGIGGLGRR